MNMNYEDMNYEDMNEEQVILADDVNQIGVEINPQQKLYTRIFKGPKSLSKEGDKYSSPARNQEVYRNSEKLKKEKEQEYEYEQLRIKQQSQKTQSQIVIKQTQEEDPQTKRMTQSLIKF